MSDAAMETPIYVGSSRDVFRVNPGILEFKFTDTFSVFDVGIHHQQIPGKAEALCASAVRSFEIAERLGVETHFIEQVNSVAIRVREFRILEPMDMTVNMTGHILPLEFIDGSHVAGSLGRDFRSGKKKPTDFGFETDEPPKDGTPLHWPEQRYTTKREEYDRPLTSLEARALASIMKEEEERLWRVIHRLNGGLSLVAAMAGFTRFDGKKEAGLGLRRRPVILDTFGTPDEDRFVLTASLRKGEIVHYSKEMIRKIFIANGYYKELMAAREAGKADLPYPDLTKTEIAEVGRRYQQFAEAYCSVKFENVSSQETVRRRRPYSKLEIASFL